MTKHKTTPAAYDLLQRGSIALAEIEHNGVRVDKGYLEDTDKKMTAQVADLERQIRNTREFRRVWKPAYGDRTKIGSRDQIADVVFSKLGHDALETTAIKKRAKANKENLERVDLEMVRLFLKAESIKKAQSTYVHGIMREMVERDGMWFVHPDYHLNRVITFRSSCSNPNFQNNPVRDEEIANLIRPAYIPRPGRHFVEVDYGQIEVRVAACYTKDPTLMAYVSDPSKDMHGDMAARLFMLPRADVGKPLRHVAKNKFVFPSFYGSYYKQCAAWMWEDMTRRGLRTGKGNDVVLIADHLRSKGIDGLGACDPERDPVRGTFEYHVQQQEKWFWDSQYPVYHDWKKSKWERYLREGGFTSHTGFAVNGPFKKNEVLNSEIQGSAFHCLLWSLTKILPRLRKYGMKSLVIGEIHDSFQMDAMPRELDDVLTMSRQIMTEEIRRHWDWIVVPLEVEAEVSSVNKSWHEKKVWTEAGGRWSLKA